MLGVLPVSPVTSVRSLTCACLSEPKQQTIFTVTERKTSKAICEPLRLFATQALSNPAQMLLRVCVCVCVCVCFVQQRS